MIEEILKFDTELFIYLNNLGTSNYDYIWVYLSEVQANAIPYLFLFIFFFYNNSSKVKFSEIVYLLFFVFILITISDQTANLFKDSFQRLRPCYNEIIQDSVRLVKETCGGKYSFFSAHASSSFSLAIFFGLLYRKRLKFLIWFTVLLAILISYSRVYLGVHYPLDILFGALFGILNGILLYRVYQIKLRDINFFNKS